MDAVEERVIPPALAALIERVLSQEDLELEYKAAQGGVPRSIWETVSAFANTNGGWIILGVDDSTDPPTLLGLSDAPRLLMEFVTTLRNPSKINFPACGPNDVLIESVDGLDLIVIRVPVASRKNRPVYIGSNPVGGTYIRNYAGDFQCSQQEVVRMLREASEDALDSRILEHFTVDDLDSTSIARYRQLFQNQNPTSNLNSYSTRDFLVAMRAYGRDRNTDKEGVTVAGLLMFGTEVALREWRTPHYIDFRRVGFDPTQRWDDRFLHEGNLLDAYFEISPRLTSGLAAPFRLEEGKRIDQGPQHAALREALVNLLVHTDYGETDAALIVRAPDEYSFRNPGNSRVRGSNPFQSSRSDARNPDVFSMFRRIGFAEEAGTGIRQIFDAWTELGMRPPTIDLGVERYEFRLQLRIAHLIAEEDREWLNSLGSGWSEAEQLALLCARDEDYIDNATLRSLTKLNVVEATRVLGGLRARGFLEMTGTKRTARYQLGSAALVLTHEEHEDKRFNSSTEEPNLSTEEPNLSTEEFDSANVHTVLSNIVKMAHQQRRLGPQSREQVILELCAVTALSLNQIADLIKISPSTVRISVQRLLETKDLMHVYPDQPSHPRQKVRAARPRQPTLWPIALEE